MNNVAKMVTTTAGVHKTPEVGVHQTPEVGDYVLMLLDLRSHRPIHVVLGFDRYGATLTRALGTHRVTAKPTICIEVLSAAQIDNHLREEA